MAVRYFQAGAQSMVVDKFDQHGLGRALVKVQDNTLKILT
jgi:hypothetical protein